MTKDNYTPKSTFNKLFSFILTTNFLGIISLHRVDKYVKKFKMIKFIYLLCYAQINEKKSLRDITVDLQSNTDLQKAIELESISHSQLSRKLRDIKIELIEELFCDIVKECTRKHGAINVSKQTENLNIIDASTISLCFSKYKWADYKSTKNGVKLHLGIRLFSHGVYPDTAIITPAKHADRTRMDDLVTEDPNIINVFDRGYIDYKKFDEYCDNNITFVTRLKSNAVKKFIEEYPLDNKANIESDEKVLLGRKNHNQMKHPLRIIKVYDTRGKLIIILTNNFKMSAEEISEIYRNRWKIELFFKWIKQNFRVKKFYGTSKNAVITQIYIALITYCLLLLMKLKYKSNQTLLTIQRILKNTLFLPFEEFEELIFKPPTRKTKGRQVYDHIEEFERINKLHDTYTHIPYDDYYINNCENYIM